MKYEQAPKKDKPKCIYDASEKKTRPEAHPNPKQSLKNQNQLADNSRTDSDGAHMGKGAAPNSFSTDPAKVSFSTEVPCLMNIMWQAQQQRPSSQAQVRPSLLLVLPCSPPTNTFTDFIDRSLARVITRALTGPFTRFSASSFPLSLTGSLTLSSTYSLTRSFTGSLPHSLNYSTAYWLSLTHSCTVSPGH